MIIKTKKSLLKKINLNFNNFELFNVICSNVFKNFIFTGKRSKIEIFNLLKIYTNTTEFFILYFFYKYNMNQLTDNTYTELLSSNIFFKNLLYLINIFNKVTWKQFMLIVKNSKKKNIFFLLSNILRILKIKKNFNLYLNGIITEGHFRLVMSSLKININILNTFSYIEDINLKQFNLYKLNNKFIDVAINFYDTLIQRYHKFNLYTTNNRTLGIFTRKKYKLYLKKKKKQRKKSYAEKLAHKYLGRGFKLSYSKKWKNLRYRAYRIFLYTFKIKPFKLWQITRKSRKGKNKGLLDYLAYFELTIKNIMLLSNFNLNLQEFKIYLNNGFICVNGRIILSINYIIKAYDIIHFVNKIVKNERNRFLLNLLSSFEKSIFVKNFSTLFEYNFASYCFTMLPGFLKHKFVNLSPYYTNLNSGRFTVQKV